jgi:pyruvate/2-oxoglutarate dehydrogenase complex dihydrolipoamide acyltransferase (E2) component
MHVAEVRVPKFGTSGDTVEILDILVAVGDSVSAGQGLIEAASDKVDFSIESESDGRVTAILCEVGDDVDMGAVVVELEP